MVRTRRRYKNLKDFNLKGKPLQAMGAAGVSLLTIITFGIVIAVSASYGGDSPKIIGGVGFLALIVSLVAFIYNIRQIRIKGEFVERLICLIISLIAFAAWAGIFIFGMFN